MTSFKFIVLFTFFSFPVVQAFAQKMPWEEYEKKIAMHTTISPLSNDLFNEHVDLYNGRVSFQQVDIDLPGNSALPVRFARKFSVEDRSGRFNWPNNNGYVLAMEDWDLDIPRISGVYAHHLTTYSNNTYGWANNRCSGPRSPEMVGPFWPLQYWHGIHADMPGGGELLAPSANSVGPTSGGPYRWVTVGFTWFSCLPTIKNSTGEGFLAITQDGTKYWFDWKAMTAETTLENSDIGYVEMLYRKQNSLYVTRVEDRFGNWVTYDYSNAATSPVRLTKIQSNDGRQIDIVYNTQGRVASATAGSRTWTYSYAAQTGAVSSLTNVVLPDGSRWEYDLKNLALVSTTTGDAADCDLPGFLSPLEYPGNYIGTIKHPSGATAEFEVSQRLHGRSDVPKVCNPGEYPYQISDFVRIYWVHSLIRKRVSGPGLVAMEWNYIYNNSRKFSDRVGGAPYVSPGSWALNGTYWGTAPACVSDSCADTVSTDVSGPGGDWTRYTFGNSYRYNEHKLLKVERGTGPGAISRIDTTIYELSLTGQNFPTPVGVSLQYKGDSWNEAFLRPMKSASTIQDGRQFNRTITAFDAFARPLTITKSSSPYP